MARSGGSRQGKAGMVGYGAFRYGWLWSGRQGEVWQGLAGSGLLWQGRHGVVCSGAEGWVRFGRHGNATRKGGDEGERASL